MNKLKEYRTSLYDTMKSKDCKVIDLENYVGMVQYGTNQDAVINARLVLDNEEQYKKIKSQSMVITPTGIFDSGVSKEGKNLKPNGIVCIDVDTVLTEDQIHALYVDQYTFIIHKSFSGRGYCIFVKIDSGKLDNAYTAVSKYYYDQYGIHTDPSCKNINRLRYVSYDPDILVVDNSKKFNVKVEKKDAEPKAVNYIYTSSDFDNILSQIRDRSTDLCQEDYYRYLRIGLAFASEFGESGRSNYHFVCSFGSKYEKEQTDKDYNGFLKRGDGKCKIGTFYYYCKEAGIDIYSDRTRAIINRVSIAKSQGGATVDSVSDNLTVVTGQVPNEEEVQLINRLINDKTDYSKLANDDISEIKQLTNFIIDMYSPEKDEITQIEYVNGKRMEDTQIEDIYLACLEKFGKKNVAKGDVRSILNSSNVKKINKLKDFLRDNDNTSATGALDAYVDCIHPQNEYNRWAFKKWYVGSFHNWLCDYYDKEASPLTLVLTGGEHGTGKTSWCKDVLPSELQSYFVQSKLSENKDNKFRLGESLIVFDDEFGGKAFSDDKAYKELSQLTHITERKSYGYKDTTVRRRASLIASSNEVDIVKDPTGNRRLLPIMVERIEYDKMKSLNKTDMFMEAYNLYKSGFEWKIFSKEDKDYLYDNTTTSLTVLPMEEVFFKYFSIDQNTLHNTEVVMNQGEVLQFLTQNSGLKPNKFEVKEVFTKNKFMYKSHKIDGRVKNGVKLFMSGIERPPF